MKDETYYVIQKKDNVLGLVNVPIYLSSTYRQLEPGKPISYEYARTQNPTREIMEEIIAKIEGGKYGFLFSSGMSAIDTLLSILNPNDHILVDIDIYGGTYRILEKLYRKFNIHIEYADFTNLEELSKKINVNTRMLIVETISNPLLRTPNIEEISKIKKNAILVVDNTFATPYYIKPLEFGADIVVHSITKYLSGHSDIVMGAIILNNDKLAHDIKFYQNSKGGVPSPFDLFLLSRGLKTLHIRMEKHTQNASRISEFLKNHKNVSEVYYPGYSGMVSFRIKKDIIEFAKRLEIITLGESLGGVESLLNVPYYMTHASMPEEERAKRGITKNLVRLSVGIENIEDLIKDLENALL
ncbi:MAG: PLP-dependent aspartate aminotransferase family protein [candidate division WOR-3 bacterium]|nr:PLP-dependent aspartate aminotransferase family protein [candidate division WOR-3 bacterium]MCX7947532.1 PLP-dependent aspartate aminotransferase family protein [candidate division WOR-3 bacterium]MDW8150418.1 aminotransferase class I/II-fold pyridoxal phosphate-dependent enzyme [candidate division WOR-3 bacterium]